MRLITAISAAMLAVTSYAEGYDFTTVTDVAATPVKDQASSGTCWSFSTASFLESELLRKGRGEYDLSEMFIVRQKLLNQLDDNYLRQGKGNVSDGSLSHTFINAMNKVGLVPEEAYIGLTGNSVRHNHYEMMTLFRALADAGVKAKSRSPQYMEVVKSLLDTYLGEVPQKFTYKGKEYTPESFAKSIGIDSDDYVELTSFTHKPYYKPFELEVPDNWEHARQYNLPLDELIAVIDGALANGYTVCWDGDVSEPGFLHSKGVAIIPETSDLSRHCPADSALLAPMSRKDRQKEILKCERPFAEAEITPQVRQNGYESFVTTDDHLMHITGSATDSRGTKYYKTKNSWGTESNSYGGYLYMSEPYVKAKTIYVMVNKAAIPEHIRKKLKL